MPQNHKAEKSTKRHSNIELPRTDLEANTMADIEDITSLLSCCSIHESVNYKANLPDTDFCLIEGEEQAIPTNPVSSSEPSFPFETKHELMNAQLPVALTSPDSELTASTLPTSKLSPAIPAMDQPLTIPATELYSCPSQVNMYQDMPKIPKRKKQASSKSTPLDVTSKNDAPRRCGPTTRIIPSINDKNTFRKHTQSIGIQHTDDKAISHSPDVERPVWTTVPKKSNLKPGFNRAIEPARYIPQLPARVNNPYIHESRLFNGDIYMVLLHPSVSKSSSSMVFIKVFVTLHLTCLAFADVPVI